MKLKKCVWYVFIISLYVVGVSVAGAEAEISAFCTPIYKSSIPYTINASGVYCLANDLITSMTSGNVITVNANDVVIDLNDHRIGGAAAGPATQAIGIYGNQRSNIIIKNGLIRGFYYGIKLEDTSGNTSAGNAVENVRAGANTYYGIYVAGKGSRVHCNTVLNTGGSSVSGIVDAYGIYVNGLSSRIRDNTVAGTTEKAGGNSYAIYLDSSSNDSMVDNNQLTNQALGFGTSDGLYVNASNVIALDNKIFNMTRGLFFIDGTGIYKNNFALQVTTPFTGGTPASTTVTNYSNP